MSGALTATVELEIYVLDISHKNGTKPKAVVDVTNNQILSLEVTVGSFISNTTYEIELVDLNWDILDKLELFKPITQQLYRIRLRYGWNKPVWRYKDVPSSTAWLNASVIDITPRMAGDSLTATIRATSAQLEAVLLNEVLTETYTPTAKTYIKIYEEIADKFNIDLVINGGKASTVSIGDKTVPAKKVRETGLDYLARIYETLGLQINGKPTHARFNPFPYSLTAKDNSIKSFEDSNIKATGYGIFEIFPESDWTPSVTYNYRGVTSKVLSYAPKLNPWIARKAQAAATVVSLNEKTGESKTHNSKINSTGDNLSDFSSSLSLGSSTKNSSSTGNRIITNSSAEVSKIKVQQAQNNLLSRALLADITILGDPYLAFREYVRINVYQPLSGELKASSIFSVQSVNHSISGGFFSSSISLITTPDYYSLLNKKAEKPSFSMTNTELPFIADAIKGFNEAIKGFNEATGGFFA